jgi:hypothetical protein
MAVRITDTYVKQEFIDLLIDCKAMELSTVEALAYIHSHGFSKVKDDTYFRAKRKLESETLKQAAYIAKQGLLEQHMDRIHKLKAIEKRLWLAYNRMNGKSPEKAVKVLPALFQIQPYISQAYKALKGVMEEQARIKKLVFPVIEKEQ